FFRARPVKTVQSGLRANPKEALRVLRHTRCRRRAQALLVLETPHGESCVVGKVDVLCLCTGAQPGEGKRAQQREEPDSGAYGHSLENLKGADFAPIGRTGATGFFLLKG